ncbi:MAG: VOC family protein [Pacificimonas sp.]
MDHVQLAMPTGGEAKARMFFKDLLGMTELAKPETLSPHGCWFTSDPVQIHVGSDPDFKPATKAHPALLVRDLQTLSQRLKAAGFPVTFDDRLPGYDRCFTEDPFGNRIELMQPRT